MLNIFLWRIGLCRTVKILSHEDEKAFWTTIIRQKNFPKLRKTHKRVTEGFGMESEFFHDYPLWKLFSFLCTKKILNSSKYVPNRQNDYVDSLFYSIFYPRTWVFNLFVSFKMEFFCIERNLETKLMWTVYKLLLEIHLAFKDTWM